MLYDAFRFSVMIASVLGIIHMIAVDSYIYIYFPIVIEFWGIYSFVDAREKEDIRRNGGSAHSSSWFGTWYDDYEIAQNKTHHRTISSYSTRTTTKNNDYKTISKKCKRNFKITIGEENG